MNIAGFETAILHVPEEDPLTGVVKGTISMRPVVTLRLRTDSQWRNWRT
jgi:hypothetical protein